MTTPVNASAAPVKIDAELLLRLDKPGPRYTSYPTVPYWSEAFGPEAYAERLVTAGKEGKDVPLSLYLHVPFCKEMCTYCGCNVVISSDRNKYADFVEALRDEIDLTADRLGARRELLQVHVGGGTPTSLDEILWVRLWDKIRERFVVRRDAEVAIEVDPVVTSTEQLALLRGFGFDRVSMGVQDFTPTVQDAVNRHQTFEETERLVNYARKAGYRSVNFDLIHGLPRQTVESFGKTVDQVIRMSPDRLAIFSYAHVPEMRPHQKKIDAAELPKPLQKWELFAIARDKLLAGGWAAIGMDHFAKEGDELAVAQRERRLSRNFQGYTVRPAPDIIACGPSAIADVAGAYAQNIRTVPAWSRAVRAGTFATEKGCVLTADDKLRRDAITQVMCNFHLDLNALSARQGVDAKALLAPSIAKLAPMVEDGLVELSPDVVDVTEKGKTFVRNIAAAFDAYFGTTTPDEKKLPIFSRTI